MMKSRFAILFIGCLTVLKLQGQICTENLVPNPSFEDTLDTRDGIFPMYFVHVANWTSPNKSTPDIYNDCLNYFACSGSIPGLGQPKNRFGYQNPFHERSYLGMILHYDFKEEGYIHYREYAQVKLHEPLKPCKEYELSFYVSLADTSNYATQDIQAHISRDSLTGIVFDIIDNVTPITPVRAMP